MKCSRIVRLAAGKGFTLVETLIVMVVLGIGAVAIISLQGNIFSGQSANQTIQVGVQLMQECAEQILAKRRSVTNGYGYSSIVESTVCSTLGNYGGIVGVPIVTATPDVGTAGTCTSASSTCLVTITIAGLTSITLQLVRTVGELTLP